jgi:NADPH:quinone reductase
MHSYDGDKAGRRAIVMELIDLFAQGQLKPAIAARFRLDEVRAAHELLDSGSACGRIVMLP